MSGGRPKAMIEVEGVPFADHQLRMLSKQGITEVVYSVNYLGNQIEEFVGDGSRYGFKVQYVYDGERQLGTGGALRRVFDEGKLKNLFLVTYGDTLLQISFCELLKELEKHSTYDAVMSIYRNDDGLGESNVEQVGGGLINYDKVPGSRPFSLMTHTDYGAIAIRRSAVEALVGSESVVDLAKIFTLMSKRGTLGSFEVFDRFYEIGTPESLMELSSYLKNDL